MGRLLTSTALAAGLFVGGVCGVCPATASAGPRQQLSVTLPELPLNGVAFSDAVDFLRDVSGANIVVNWKALEEAGVGKDTPINLRLRGISLRKAIDMVLTEAGGGDKLSYEIDQNVIEITTREIVDSRMFTRVYPIQDLIMEIPDFTDAPDFSLNTTSNNSSQNPASSTGGANGSSGQSLFGGGGTGKETHVMTREERVKELIDLIEAVIQPDIWVENGGKAAIRFWNGNLIITAPRSAQEAIGGSWD